MCRKNREIPERVLENLKREESNRYRLPMEDARWRISLRSVKQGLSRLDMAETRSVAESIAEGIRWLDIFMTRYCSLTCPSCEDPCCHGKDIFYNQADLIYLSSLGGFMPPGQTRMTTQAPCRYLGTNGCSLSRLARPYVCVWFVCDAQMEIFREENISFQRRVITVMQDIRTCRLKLESLFEQANFGT
jgi:hypothetical protein